MGKTKCFKITVKRQGYIAHFATSVTTQNFGFFF